MKPTLASPLGRAIPSVNSGTNAKLLFNEGGLTTLYYAEPPAIAIAGAAKANDSVARASQGAPVVNLCVGYFLLSALQPYPGLPIATSQSCPAKRSY